MIEQRLSIHGMGAITDGYADIGELAKIADPPPHIRAMIEQAQTMDPAKVESQDMLAQLALRSVHQAWTMAPMAHVNTERVGLILSVPGAPSIRPPLISKACSTPAAGSPRRAISPAAFTPARPASSRLNMASRVRARRWLLTRIRRAAGALSRGLGAGVAIPRRRPVRPRRDRLGRSMLRGGGGSGAARIGALAPACLRSLCQRRTRARGGRGDRGPRRNRRLGNIAPARPSSHAACHPTGKPFPMDAAVSFLESLMRHPSVLTPR